MKSIEFHESKQKEEIWDENDSGKSWKKTKGLRFRLGQEQEQKLGTQYGHRRRQWTKAVAEILSSRLSECQSFSTHIPILSPHFNKIDDDNNQFAANLISVFDQAEATS